MRLFREALSRAFADAATFFEVENDERYGWTFDAAAGGRISQPVLYVIGGASGPHQPATVQAFTALFPQAEGVTIPGVNHLMVPRNPGPVATVIREFVGRHSM